MELTQITSLAIAGCHLTDSDVVHIAALTGLEELCLWELLGMDGEQAYWGCLAIGLKSLRKLHLFLDSQSEAAAELAFQARYIGHDDRTLMLRPVD